MIAFTIPGVPVSWDRATPLPFKARDGRLLVRMITSEKTRNGELAFRLQAAKWKPRKPLAGPLRVDLVFFLPRPASLHGDRSRVWPGVRPDRDNYEKLVFDSLNGMFWTDDGQICDGSTRKIYDSKPRTEVRISQLTDADTSQCELWGGMDGR